MLSLLDVFLSIDSIAAMSLLSIYSTSGLFIESQVDIVSSIETDNPSDLDGDMSILLWTEGTMILDTVASFLVTDVLLLKPVCFKGTDVEKIPVLLTVFFGSLIFDTGGTVWR
jgi:hypothetical protein